MTMKRLIALLAIAVLASVASCGASDSLDGDTSSDVVIGVGDLIDRGPGNAEVQGFIVWQPDDARLCEALAESFPPQCGLRSVPIANPEAFPGLLQAEGATQWTPNPVSLTGHYDGATFTITP